MLRSIPIYAASVTASDTANLDAVSVIYIGGDGNVKVTTEGGDAVTFNGVSAGDILPVAVARVWSTGTTASDIIALW